MQNTTAGGLVGARSASLRRQLVRSRPVLVFAAALFFLVMAVVQGMSMWLDLPFWHFTQDPASVAELSWSVGLVSQFGVMLWSATVAVCALASVLLWPMDEHRPWALFAGASGAISLVCLLDDALLVHENIMRDHLGIPEVVTYAAYAALGLAYLVRFAWAIRRTDFHLLLGSFACGGISMVVDVVNPYAFFPEDGAKFLGIMLWFSYFFQTMRTVLNAKRLQRASRTYGA